MRPSLRLGVRRPGVDEELREAFRDRFVVGQAMKDRARRREVSGSRRNGPAGARPAPTISSVNVATEMRASPSGGAPSGRRCSAATKTLVSTS
jgi:hypothetical protein